MNYIVYMTVNTVNKKIYVGVHKTSTDIFDGYIGCGVNINNSNSYKKSKTPFQLAVGKYGTSAFKRITLKEFDLLEEALQLEAEIVNKEFIQRNDTYNVALGGGSIPLTSKVTYQYDLNGNFLKEYESKVAASIALNCSESSIGTAILFKTTSMGYLWSYAKYEKLDISEYNIYSNLRDIYKYNENGEYLEKYISITEAANCNNTTTSNIQRAIKGKFKVHGNFFSEELFGKFILPEKISSKSKEIHQYSLNGDYIATFKNIKDVVTFLGIKSSSPITTSIRLGRACGDFQWSFDKLPYMKKLVPTKEKKRRVGQYSKDGEFIKEFSTVTAAKNEFGSGVVRCLKNQIEFCKNYKFRYLD